MNKFYAIAAAALMAASAYAQDGAPLYVTGGAIDESEGAVSPWGISNWNAEDPAELTFAEGKYTGEFKGITMFKISTAKGDWDAFNAGAYGCKYGKEPGKAVELEAGYTENIVCPWPGDYRIEVSGDLKTITLTTDTPNPNPGGPTKVYLRGEMNGWGAPAEWEMTYAEGSYYFNCTGEQMVLAGQTFKIADANWTEINYGVEEGAIVIQDDVAIWEPNGKDAKFEADWNGGMKCTIQEDGAALAEFSSTAIDIPASGIADIEASDNAAPVYFNLQGVRVANAENGLYIVKQGSKVSKVLVK